MADKIKGVSYWLQNFQTRQNIGNYWYGLVPSYFPFTLLAQQYTVLQVSAWGLHTINWWFIRNPVIPSWAIVIYVIGKFYGEIVIRAIVAYFVINSKAYEAQQQFTAKNEKLNPFNVEMINQFKEHTKVMNAIAEAVKISNEKQAKDTFTNL